MKRRFVFTALLLLLVGCSQPEEPVPAPTTAVVSDAADIPQPEATLPASPTVAPAADAVQSAATAEPAAEATQIVEIAVTETAVPPVEPIEVTYFTPSQQEGPYYPVSKPEDSDNDLVDFAGAAGPPEGQILELGGAVYGANGLPLAGITVEIWQTDASGVYLHPNDPGTDRRDPNFQFFGEAVTGSDGRYAFRTILPGLYEPRPRHIHVKVKRDGQELLTTQFYFAGEVDLRGDDAAMLIVAMPGQDVFGNPIVVGQRDIILNVTMP